MEPNRLFCVLDARTKTLNVVRKHPGHGRYVLATGAYDAREGVPNMLEFTLGTQIKRVNFLGRVFKRAA